MSQSIPIFLGLGCNTGHCRANLKKAIRLLAFHIGPIEAESSIYRTAPWGDPNQPDYLNQVVRLQTLLPAQQVLKEILAIEASMGRRRDKANRNAPRVIDIDVLYYGQKILQDCGLEVPHPRAHRRNFVLEPMNEIAPDWIDPVSGKTMAQLAKACTDRLAVSRLNPDANTEG